MICMDLAGPVVRMYGIDLYGLAWVRMYGIDGLGWASGPNVWH